MHIWILLNIYIISLNKKLEEQMHGLKFKVFCFLFKPCREKFGM